MLYLTYVDETGDDGYPGSSDTFIMTSLYMPYVYWRNNFNYTKEFRQQLKKDFGFPVKQEMHTNNFLLDKNPYHGQYSPLARKNILELFCRFIARLELHFVNVVIGKAHIKDNNYPVLENALKYNVQRIENDLNQKTVPCNFLIITDEGRVGKMTKLTRMIQKFNFIPSQYNPQPYRNEIQNLIEDPLPKDSKESYFIQFADLVGYIVHMYVQLFIKEGGKIPNRALRVLSPEDVHSFMEILRPVLNEKASKLNFGIVYYPK